MKRMIMLLALVAAMLAAAQTMAQELSQLAPPERQAMNDTLQYALDNNPTNQAADWVNPDTGRAGAVVPIRTFTDDRGRPCREYVTTIVIGGVEQQGYGTACRQPDGFWRKVDTSPAAPPPQNRLYVYSPPQRYYYYPPEFYGPFRIYLSFGTVFRGGHLYRGHFYLDGRVFRQRHRYPLHYRHRLRVVPRHLDRYRRHERFDYRYRDRYRDRDRYDRRGRYRDRDRDGRRDRGRGRGRD
jgi:surface antigen